MPCFCLKESPFYISIEHIRASGETLIRPIRSHHAMRRKSERQRTGIPHLREEGIESFPAIHIQDSQPELPPGRDAHCTTCKERRNAQLPSQ